MRHAIRFFLFIFFIATAVLTAIPAWASLIYTPNNYSLSTRGLSLSNAITADEKDPASAYYSPAALSETQGFEFGAGYFYSMPNLEGGLVDGKRVHERFSNRIVAIGLRASLAQLFVKDSKLRIGLGFNVVSDDNFGTMMAFSDMRTADGDFYRYGLANFLMQAALGVGVTPWLSLGIGFHGGFRGEGNVETTADIDNTTEGEGTEMLGRFHPVPLGGLYLHKKIGAVGFAYREETFGTFETIDVKATPKIEGLKLPTMFLPLSFLDTFVPRQVSAGLRYQAGSSLTLLADLTWCQWSRYELKSSNSQYAGSLADFETKDTWIPKAAGEYLLLEGLDIRAGYRYEPTPFETIGTRFPIEGRPEIAGKVVLDNDLHALSVGAGYKLPDNRLFKPAVSFDAAYQFQYMVPRTAKTSDGDEFDSKGYVHVLSGSIRFGF